ncbi:MAG: hypothetical protein HKN19_14710 [Halioglobus sp.]|nr:hypothetical protein [Halioglobus sp.]
MSLRRQLLVVALLLLSLPWAGCQFVREMEGALRAGQAQSLMATGEAVAGVLAQYPTLIYPHAERRAGGDTRRSLYAVPTTAPVIVDGYDDGWERVQAQSFGARDGAAGVEAMAQTRGDTLYLLFRVHDEEIVYHNPGLSQEANGDRLVLRLWQGGQRQDYVLATSAPGQVRARAASVRQHSLDPGRIRGVWQDDNNGYTLELELPLSYTGGRLGFYFINERLRDGRRKTFIGNTSRGDSAAPPWLVYNPGPLRALLVAVVRPGTEIAVLDRQGWQVGRVQRQVANTEPGGDTFWLLQWLYRTILADDDLRAPPQLGNDGKLEAPEAEAALAGRAAHQRYRDAGQAGRTLLSSAVPVTTINGQLGAVLVRESSETYLSLTDEAFGRLLGYSTVAMLLGIGALLAYASVLSWRIRKLSLAASRAVDDNGRVAGDFPRSQLQDELGELSREYGDLLQRVRRYNDYLHSLSRKLSHELRTPIAVIQGSLDNLEASDESHKANYITRAREGLARLQRILTAMGEASALEDSIRSQPLVPTTLNQLLEEIFPVYRDLYKQHGLALALPSTKAETMAAPELLVQALDKLLDNAASFAPEGGQIRLRLVEAGNEWHIQVANQGPPLPDDLGDTLFEAMVTRRDPGSDEVHLGLGLHIVRLVMEHHEGKVMAENTEDGVMFTLALKVTAD